MVFQGAGATTCHCPRPRPPPQWMNFAASSGLSLRLITSFIQLDMRHFEESPPLQPQPTIWFRAWINSPTAFPHPFSYFFGRPNIFAIFKANASWLALDRHQGTFDPSHRMLHGYSPTRLNNLEKGSKIARGSIQTHCRKSELFLFD